MMKKIFTLLFLAALSLGLYAEKQVSGVVVYENGEPVIGASIQAKGTTQGTISDYDGKFEMEVPESVKTLVVSYVGMATIEVEAGKNLKITMQENSEVIQEVVVTGYGNVSKGSFAGSAQAVNAENIEKKSPSEISKALAGEVAGVQVVTTTGQPGEAASIRIRGIGSLNASSAPLYIVDGVPYEAAYISTIDPGDIASTTILKDATATSLYGSRGANGVIVITTKKGTSGEQGKIDVDIKYGGNMRLLPMYDVITDPQEFAEMAWMSIYNASSRATEIGKAKDASDMLFGAKGIPEPYNLWQVVNDDGTINTNPKGGQLIGNNGKFLGAEDGVQYKPGMDKLTSWRDAIFRVGQKLDATVRISGGTEKTTYFTSIGYLKDEGYYIGSTYDRFTIRSNVDFQPKKWLKGNVNMAYTYSNQNAAGQGDNMNSGFVYVNQMAPVFPVFLYNADGTIKTDPKTGGYAYDYGMFEGYGRPFGSGINPAGSLRYDRDNIVQHYVMAGGSLEFKFYKDLKLIINANMQYRGAKESEFTNAYYGDAGGIGRIATEQDEQMWITAQQLLEYNKTIGEHSIRAMAGHETQVARSSYIYGSKSHVAVPEGENVLELGNAIQNTTITSATNSTALESFLATASYIYNERYGVTANYRADGSSKFAKGHRWGHFGSVGGTWMFTNEDFIQSSDAKDWLKDGKLRLSWGVLGNQGGISTQLFQDLYSIEYVDAEVGYVWAQKGNKDLTWERSQIVDLGLEFGIGKYLSAEIDYFWKSTDNMLFYRPVAPSLGYTSIPINGGAMVNQGVELQFNVHAVDTRNVKLDIRLNGSHYAHKITKLPEYAETEEDMVMASGLAVGHSPYDWYLPEYVGINDKGEALYVGYYDPNLGGFGTGNSATNLQIYGRSGNNYVASVYEYMKKYYPGQKAEDVLKTEIISGAASRYAGSNFIGKSRIPAFAGGFGIDLDAYGFTFSATCSYGLGGYGYDVVYAELMNSDKIGKCNWHVDMRNAWNSMMTEQQQAAVVAQGANAIPRLSNGSDLYANMSSTRFLTSLSFLSLNNIRIGYNFPKKWMQKIKFNSLNIYVSADNLALASARRGYNPMASFTGTSDSYQYTPLSTIMGGIKFQF